MEISKELLVESLQEIDIEKSFIEYNILHYVDIHGNKELLHISQIIHNFIIWASIKHKWNITSYYSELDNGWLLYEINNIPYVLELSNELNGCIYNNPFEPIIKACQWILENKDIK